MVLVLSGGDFSCSLSIKEAMDVRPRCPFGRNLFIFVDWFLLKIVKIYLYLKNGKVLKSYT